MMQGTAHGTRLTIDEFFRQHPGAAVLQTSLHGVMRGAHRVESGLRGGAGVLSPLPEGNSFPTGGDILLCQSLADTMIFFPPFRLGPQRGPLFTKSRQPRKLRFPRRDLSPRRFPLLG